MNTIEKKVIDTLNRYTFIYEVINVDDEFSDNVPFCSKFNVKLDQIANTILITTKRGEKKYCVCMVLADKRLDLNGKVKHLLGTTKVSLVNQEELYSVCGMEVGGVTPFSMPDDFPLFVDSNVMKKEWVLIGGGSRLIKIKISPASFLKIGATVIENLSV